MLSKQQAQKYAKQEAELAAKQVTTGTTSKAEWDKIAQDSLQLFLSYESNPHWKLFGEKPCLMYSMEVQSRTVTKGIIDIPVDPSVIIRFLDDVANNKLVDSMNEEAKLLYKDDKYEVDYLKYKATWPVSARDFVLLAVTREYNNKVYMLTRSINYGVPAVKGAVRGDVVVGSYCIERVGDKKTRLTYISDSDVKGWIPGTIKNMVAKSQAEVPANVAKALGFK